MLVPKNVPHKVRMCLTPSKLGSLSKVLKLFIILTLCIKTVLHTIKCAFAQQCIFQLIFTTAFIIVGYFTFRRVKIYKTPVSLINHLRTLVKYTVAKKCWTNKKFQKLLRVFIAMQPGI